jgi:hypothetical protein
MKLNRFVARRSTRHNTLTKQSLKLIKTKNPSPRAWGCARGNALGERGGARPRRGHTSRAGMRAGTALGVHAAEGRGLAPGPGRPRARGLGSRAARGPGAAREGLHGGAHIGEKKGARAGKGRGGRGRGRERGDGRGGELTSGIQIPAITVSKT